jgi:hypothetical protein
MRTLLAAGEKPNRKVIAATFDQAEARDPARRRTWVMAPEY